MIISKIFSDGMIIERDCENPVEGISGAGDKIKITFDGEVYETVAPEDGRWSVNLKPHKFGGPFELVCEDGEDKKIIKDIYVGDVFLLSGQSNMELPVNRTLDLYAAELKEVSYPEIRMFQLPKEASFGEPDDMPRSGSWVKACLPEVMDFSAVGFYFAQKKFDEDGIPVGLVHAAVGGTHIEAFMSEKQVLKTGAMNKIRAVKAGRPLKCICLQNDSCKFCYSKVIEADKILGVIEETTEREMKHLADWTQKLYEEDLGIAGDWKASEWTDKEKEEAMVIDVPSSWINIPLGKMCGSVWVQRTVEVPESFCNEDIELRLGTIVDADATYVNGVLVGSTEYFYPPRRYKLAKGILKPGRNVITVRVIITNNVGEFKTEMPYCLKMGDEEISLEGKWYARIGAVCEPQGGLTFFTWHPTSLYNTMIYPVRNVKFGGMLFYQGESNTRYPDDYEFLMVDMINEFRSFFGEKTPFIFAELPDFEGETWDNEGADWNQMRRAQARAAAACENTKMIRMYDLGQRNEIHVQNKKLVAERFLNAYRELQ